MDRYETLWHSLKLDLLGEHHDLVRMPLERMTLDYIARERILGYVIGMMKRMENEVLTGDE